MITDKSIPGITFDSTRYSREMQAERLLRSGARHIKHHKGSWRTLFKGARTIRPGDTVHILALVLVPTERGEDDLPPSAQPGEFLRECREIGVTVIEAWTGRSSSDASEYRAMIRDAVNALRNGSSRLAPTGYQTRGRKPKQPPEDKRATLRAMWKSNEYANAGEALEAIRSAWGIDELSEAHVRRLFGNRNG